jgi:hypothetical protein
MIYARAWIPTWGAQQDSAGQPWPLPKLRDGEFYALWFIGHTDPDLLEDEALDAMVARASADRAHTTPGEEADEFQRYLERNGYRTFSTGHAQIYLAALPEAQEGGDAAA